MCKKTLSGRDLSEEVGLGLRVGGSGEGVGVGVSSEEVQFQSGTEFFCTTTQKNGKRHTSRLRKKWVETANG